MFSHEHVIFRVIPVWSQQREYQVIWVCKHHVTLWKQLQYQVCCCVSNTKGEVNNAVDTQLPNSFESSVAYMLTEFGGEVAGGVVFVSRILRCQQRYLLIIMVQSWL